MAVIAMSRAQTQVLPLTDRANILARHQIGEGDVAEETVNLLAQVFPQMMSQAHLAFMAVALPFAAGGVERFAHRIHHLRH